MAFQTDHRGPGWEVRCTRSGFTEPLGKYGIRLGARSKKKYTFGRCKNCNRFLLLSGVRQPKGKKEMRIEAPRDKLAGFCLKHRIRKLAFFGSVLRDDFGPESDVDVLVEFEAGTRVGLFKIAGVEMELSNLLGRQVEMHTVKGLNPHFRDEVLSVAEVQFEQT